MLAAPPCGCARPGRNATVVCADGLRVRLHLRLVLALDVRVPVAMDAAADDLAVAVDPVASVGDDDVSPWSARDLVEAAVVLDGDPVVAAAGHDPVGRPRCP